jgi:hypothetical protein
MAMERDKSWLKDQMELAKREVSGWQNWKRDVIRTEVSSQLNKAGRLGHSVERSSATGRFSAKKK